MKKALTIDLTGNKTFSFKWAEKERAWRFLVKRIGDKKTPAGQKSRYNKKPSWWSVCLFTFSKRRWKEKIKKDFEKEERERQDLYVCKPSLFEEVGRGEGERQEDVDTRKPSLLRSKVEWAIIIVGGLLCDWILYVDKR